MGIAANRYTAAIAGRDPTPTAKSNNKGLSTPPTPMLPANTIAKARALISIGNSSINVRYAVLAAVDAKKKMIVKATVKRTEPKSIGPPFFDRPNRTAVAASSTPEARNVTAIVRLRPLLSSTNAPRRIGPKKLPSAMESKCQPVSVSDASC